MLTLSPSARSPGAHRAFACLLFALLLSLFLVPDVMACHKGKPHGRNAEPCGGDGGNPTPPPPGNATMYLVDEAPLDVPIIGLVYGLEMGTVACASGTLSVNNGVYGCGTTPILFQTSNFVGTFNKKHYEICSVYQDDTWLMPDTMTAGWTDDCSDGECDIEVRMTFSEGISDDTGGVADQLEAVFFGTATGTNSNPFLEAQHIKLDSFDFVFSSTGAKRSAGNCTFYLRDVHLSSNP